MNYTINDAFHDMKETLVRNIASHIIEFEFHAKADEQTLVAYYCGGYVNREALCKDTLKRLASDQQKLRFINEHKKYLQENYGEKDPAGDIGGALQHATGLSLPEDGDSADAGENEPEGGAVRTAEPEDSADGADHSGASPEDSEGGAADRA